MLGQLAGGVPQPKVAGSGVVGGCGKKLLETLYYQTNVHSITSDIRIIYIFPTPIVKICLKGHISYLLTVWRQNQINFTTTGVE